MDVIALSKINKLHNTKIDCISLESFGAVGDGITDDSEAFQNALNSIGANGGRIVGAINKIYKASAKITKSNTCVFGINLKGTITFADSLRFISITNCNIDASDKDYGIYVASNVTKLYIDNCYVKNAKICGVYLIDCWDSILTRMSLSSNKIGLYAYQFNNGTFSGTAYGNELGIEIKGSTACHISGTIQENKLNGITIGGVHGSTFELYLEQNGYLGTTFKEQAQFLIGDNDARCLGDSFTIYAMGGSGSEMVSNFGVIALSAISCMFTGRFERHGECGFRVGSGALNCTSSVVDLTHVNYGYDSNMGVKTIKYGEFNVNTVFNIDTNKNITFTIFGGTPLLASLEKLTSTTAIIRAKDFDGNIPTDKKANVYILESPIVTALL